jgi:hypothetical protein
MCIPKLFWAPYRKGLVRLKGEVKPKEIGLYCKKGVHKEKLIAFHKIVNFISVLCTYDDVCDLRL